MTMEGNRTLVQRFFDDVCNGGRLELLDELFTRNHVYHDPTIEAPNGPAGIRRVLRPEPQQFTDHQWTIDQLVTAGRSLVIVRWTGRGTHTGPALGVAPTGKQVTVSGMWIFRIARGKVVESWNVWDAMGLAKQLGAVPAMAGA